MEENNEKNDNNVNHKIVSVIIIIVCFLCIMLFSYITIITNNRTFLIAVFAACIIMAISIYIESHRSQTDEFNNVFDKILEKMQVYYVIRSFDDDDDDNIRKYTKMDAETFSAYDEAIENNNDNFSEYDVNVENIERFYKVDSSTEEDKDVYLYNYRQILYGSSSISPITMTLINSYVLCCEIKSLKRFHIKVKEKSFDKINPYAFEDIFDDYKNIVKVFDKNNAVDSEDYRSYADIYLNNYHGKPFYIDEKDEYLELTEKDKENILEVFKKYGIHFAIILESGVLRIKANYLASNIDENEYSDKIVETLIELVNLIEKLD